MQPESAGPQSGSVRDIRLLLIPALVWLIYLWSMPRSVVLEDDGLFVLAAWNNGIAHPPGYPLYTLISHVATWWPVGSVATRVHGLNALLGAMSCLMLYRFINTLAIGRTVAATAALTFGFSLTFWGQSVVAEVYTLNILLCLVLLSLCLGMARSSRVAISDWWMSGFVAGLSLSNHWPLTLLTAPAIALLLWPRRHDIARAIPWILCGLIIGLVPYLWLIWRSGQDPLISFYGPVENFGQFWYYVSRAGYADVDQSVSAGWPDKLGFLWFVLLEAGRQFSLPALPLVIAGFIYQWRMLPLHIGLALITAFLGNTVLLIALLGFDYDPYHQFVFRVYPLVAWLVMAVWLAVGITWLVSVLRQRFTDSTWLPLLTRGLVILIIVTTLIQNLPANLRRDTPAIEDYARTILEGLAPDAILFTYGDTDSWILGYAHHVLGIRPDIELYNLKGVVYSNRLYSRFSLPYEGVDAVVRRFVEQAGRAVYYTNSFPQGYGQTDYGLYKQVHPGRDPAYRRAIILPEVTRHVMARIAAPEPLDGWERLHRRMVRGEYCQLLLDWREHAGSEAVDATARQHTDVVCGYYQGWLLQARRLLETASPDLDAVAELLGQARLVQDEALLRAGQAELPWLEGRLAAARGDMTQAREARERALAIWPHPHNPAWTEPDYQ